MPRKMKESGVEWLGQIPEGWGVRRNKYCYACGKEIVGSKSSDTTLLSLTTRGVKEKPAGAVGGKQPETFDTYQVVRPNDIVLCLFDLDCSAVFSGISHYDGMISPAYKVVSCKRFVCSQYAEYWFRFVSEGRKFKAYAKNLRYTLSYEEFETLPMLCPPLPEQERIAAFLDERCAKIDGMIAEAKASIEDYKKWKQSLIEKVTLKGVELAPIAAVNSDWVEQVPAHWRFMQIRYLFELRDERNEKPLSEVNLISLYTDKGVVQHCDLEKTTGNKAATADGYKLVYEDDIVVNIILCWMGAIGRSAYAGVTSPAYDVYRAKRKGEVLPRYYHYLFRTTAFSGACYRRGRGIMMMRWRTYSDEFRSIKVPVPSYAEQEQIANYLDEKCAAIDKLVGEKEALIADLEAYKKSLIFEAVTGKREVA